MSEGERKTLGCGCVARKHELEYLAPTFAGEELWLGTWVHENDGKLSMWRAYQILRPKVGRTVLRGRTHWVCVDLKTGKPRRLPWIRRTFEWCMTDSTRQGRRRQG